MKKLLLIFSLLILLSASSHAQRFTASVSSNPVSAGERFQVTFTLENADGSGFKAPSFKGLSVLGGPSQMQSTNWINGKMSSSFSYTYLVQADAAGKFTIEPASITVGGKRITSNPITVTVVKGSAAPQQQQSQQQGGAPSGSNDASTNKQASDLIGKNLFIKLSVSKNSVYQGEQLVATYKLYANPNMQIVNISAPKMPTFNGFWSNDLNLKEIKFDNKEVVNGVQYKVAELKQVVLLPQQSGTLKIDPMEIKFVVRLALPKQRRSRNPFDDFFDDPFTSYGDFEYLGHSNTATVNVKPLPPNPPASFNGGVGSMKLNAWLDRPRTKTNDPVTLKIQITGNGNLNLLEPFNLQLPPDIETYDPKIVDNVNISASGITGNKIFEYLLIPRHSGEYRIQPVSFTYFDLAKKTYVTLSSDEFVLKVDKGAGPEGGSTAGVDKEDIKLIGKDIRFIKTSTDGLSRRGSGLFGSGLFYLLSLMPMFLFILFFIYNRRQQKLNEDQVLLKNRRANSLARKRLALSKKYLDAGQKDKFYEEISHALWGYLSHKLGIPFADLTKDTAAIELSRRHVPQEISDRLLNTIDNSEFARFAPSADSHNMGSVYNDAVTAIIDMEGVLK